MRRVGRRRVLDESEDERIRRELIEYLRGDLDDITTDDTDRWISWIEKQKEQKPSYCHHEVDETGWTEEYRKAYYDGWNNCNMQHEQLKAGQKLETFHSPYNPDEYEVVMEGNATILRRKEQKPEYPFTPDECIKPAEWSEEDEKIISSIRHIIFGHAFENGGVDVNGDYCEDVYIQADDFLKSLRPSWKPSEEQMKALRDIITMKRAVNEDATEMLRELYEQLKKL